MSVPSHKGSAMRLQQLVISGVVSVFLASAARADAPAGSGKVPTFSVEQLSVDGRVAGVNAADLDGDGKLDLIAGVLKGSGDKTRRSLAVFWNRGGAFAGKPDLIIPLDADVCAYDLADIDGQPGAELLAITATGVRAHSLATRALGPTINLVSQPTLFLRAPRTELARYHVAQPLGPKGELALLVPGLGTLSIYQRASVGAPFVKRGQLDVEVEMAIEGGGRGERQSAQHGISELGVTARFPSIDVADLDGDGRPDLLIARDEHVRGYLQAADGSFSNEPSFVHTFAVRPKGTDDAEPSPSADEEHDRNFSIQMRLLDIDGDGRADAVITTTKTAGISSATTTVYLFFGTAKGFADQPDQVIRTEGVNFVGTQIADLTGDGHPDLLIPSFKLSLFAIIRALTAKSAKVKFLLYPFGAAERRFAEKPTAERSLTFKLSLEGGSDQQAVDMYGDFFGDKRLNLAFGEEEGVLSLYGAGAPGHIFADDPMSKVSVRGYGEVTPFDLEGAGRSDLVLHYPRSAGHESEIAVVHNHGVQ